MTNIIECIKNASAIAILPHVDPDGDCLGSSFALSLALKKIGKSAQVILENGRPPVYEILPGDFINYADMKDDSNFDLIICLDCGDEKRLGNRFPLLKKDCVTVNIDHHPTNTSYAQYNLISIHSAATGEIIYELISEMNIPMDEQIATNLYVAISTDTGAFRYSNTTSRTHAIIAKILETHINIADINRKIFDTVSLAKLRLTAEAINRIQLYKDGLIAVIVLPYKLMGSLGATDDDTEGLTSLARTVEGVEVGILIKEREQGVIKVSFRSNEYVDVAQIAEFFGGGGHKRASGCTLTMDLEEAVQKVLQRTEEELVSAGTEV